MSISIWRGDLTTLESPGVIAHQVNTLSMGAGLAKALYSEWGTVRTFHYKKAHSIGWSLGEVQLVLVDPGRDIYVANCCGQETTDVGSDNCDYKAIEMYLWTLLAIGLGFNLPIWIPEELGSGLAGGDKDRILGLIGARFSEKGDLRRVIYVPDEELVENT
jgi:hypothetical protein